MFEHLSIDDRLNAVIDNLNRAVDVCNNVGNATIEEQRDDYTKQYPFSTGWSLSAMKAAIVDLNKIVTQVQNETITVEEEL